MFLIFIISIIIYIIATVMVYHNIYNFDKIGKIKLIAIGFIISFVITVIICNISSNGINVNTNYLNVVKNASILLFAPINAVISLPYLGSIFNKYKEERINAKQLEKRIIILLIILVIVSIFEIGYIKDFQMGLIQSVVK